MLPLLYKPARTLLPRLGLQQSALQPRPQNLHVEDLNLFYSPGKQTLYFNESFRFILGLSITLL